MNTKQRIDAFVQLGQWVESDLLNNNELLTSAQHHNPWHSVEFSRGSICAISQHFLKEEKIVRWLTPYVSALKKPMRRIGLILAGNIPLVGFHDLLCVLISGHQAVIKLSSKDKILIPEICQALIAIEPRFQNQISFVDIIKDIDGIIATGNNNSARYFDYYFRKYPSLIRKHRNSIAVLEGDETDVEIMNLGKDVFQYFGLGCRNVSFIFIPKKFDVTHLLEVWGNSFQNLMDTSPYRNNYDYNRTLLLLNQIKHFANDYIMLKESDNIASPIATLHYKYYQNQEEIEFFLKQNETEIQCVASKMNIIHAVAFGKTQQPNLEDYADAKNTMQFLAAI